MFFLMIYYFQKYFVFREPFAIPDCIWYLILVACNGNDKAKELLITCDDKEMDYVMESTITEIKIPEGAELVAAEHYSGGGRNGVEYIRQEVIPAAQAGE